MSISPSLRWIVCAVGLLCCSAASAQIRKCVTASGQSIYTDKPCEAATPEKSKEVADPGVAKRLSEMNGQNDLDKSCWTINYRMGQCYARIQEDIRMIFRDQCEIPQRRFVKNQEAALYSNRRQAQYVAKQREEELDTIEYHQRHAPKSRAVLRCEELESDTWKFLNQNFASKIQPEERQRIEYKLKYQPEKTTESHSGSRR